MKYKYKNKRTFAVSNKYLTKINRMLDKDPDCNVTYVLEREITRLQRLLGVYVPEREYYNDKFILCFEEDELKF